MYERMLDFQRTPVVALNHAVAVALSAGLAEGLARIDSVGAAGELDRYYLFHAARADILMRMERRGEVSPPSGVRVDAESRPPHWPRASRT